MAAKKDRMSKQTKKAEETQEVAITAPEQNKALAKFDFGEHAGLGMDSVSGSLIKLPYLLLVQKGTPGVDKKDDRLFGQVGNFYDSITGKIYDGERGFVGVAISTKEEYIERSPAPDNKFKGKHAPNSEVVRAGKRRTEAYNAQASEDKRLGFGKIMAPAGSNMLVETHALLVVLAPVDASGNPLMDEAFGCVVPFKSTGIPSLSKWMTGITTNRSLPDGTKTRPGGIPMCANEFTLKAKYREEGKTSWYLPSIECRGKDIVSSIAVGDLYKLAIEQYDAMKAGRAAIDEDSFDTATGGGEVASGVATDKEMDW